MAIKSIFSSLFKTTLRVAILLFYFKDSIGQSFQPVVFDNKQSAYFGAYNIAFVHKAIYSYQERLIPESFTKENTVFKKLTGFGYRMSKLLLFDLQEDYLLALTQHEAFGHCARFREFGSKHNSVRISLLFPFGNGSGESQPGALINDYTAHKNLSVSMAGVEANKVLANTIAYHFLQDDSIHYRQALLYLISQNDQLLYAWIDRYRKMGSNAGRDMLGYVAKLNNLYNPIQQPYSIKKFSLQNLTSLINPIQLYSLFTIIYTYGIEGNKHLSKIPMIKFGGCRYLPYMNYILTPFGGEYFLCNAVKYNNKLFIADFGIGEGTFNKFYRVSLKGFNLIKQNKVTLNFHADGWLQPELKLKTADLVKSKNLAGGLFKADCMIHPFSKNNFSLFAQAGYKSKGFCIGESLSESFIFRFGIDL